MKIKFRQPSPGFCSVYLLANLFNDDSFLRFTDDIKYFGCKDDDINFMLAENGHDLKLCQVFYSNQNYMYLPKGYIYHAIRSFKESSIEDGVEIPVTTYLLTVRLIKEMHHHVAVLMIKDEMYYLDPYREELILIESFEQFDVLFMDCCVVDTFYFPEKNQYCIFRGEYLGYEELLIEKVQ